jgi:Cu+-exporting ATPase
MIGDGVNDAPSLALGGSASGADIAIETAPLVLMNRSLAAVTETLELVRRPCRVVRPNLFWAFVYKVAGITLAMAGVLSLYRGGGRHHFI